MLAILDNRINTRCLTKLKNIGFEPVLMPPANYLQMGVSSHPDMLLFIGFGKLFCHKLYYSKNKKLIDQIASVSNSELVISDENTDKSYPSDVLFNAVVLGDKLMCNRKTISKMIIDQAEELGYKIIDVSQGYTKCSTCVVNSNAVITSDDSIARACRTNGIDVLKIQSGYISLPPYNYGFIGGASGVYQDTVYFCGNIELHPDYRDIIEFCNKHEKKVNSLSSDELLDVGTMFLI